MFAVQLWGTKTVYNKTTFKERQAECVKKVIYGFMTWEQAQKYANKYPNPHSIQTYWGNHPLSPNSKITKAIMQNIQKNGD